MKKYLYVALISMAIFISGMFIHQRKELQKYRELYYKELQNVEAYRADNSGLKNDIRQYQMTISDLRQSKDSVDRKLTKVIDSLKIKDKRIEYLQYQTKVIYKTDTIQVPDTILVPKAHVDTIVGDKWYQLKLMLDYPSTITVSPTFKSEQFVIVNTKKEYNSKPSKLFFIRWFQKKHVVVEVNVEEKSPYIINKDNKFIKVIK